MSYSITVDGCDYTVHANPNDLTAELITVKNCNNVIIATAYINHDAESISVSYDETTAPYPYFEYTHNWEGRLMLATWIVSTHPCNG